MNLINEFNNALTISEYMDLLADQKRLHDLHYKKAKIDNKIGPFDGLNILVITEPWCGDSTAIVPVLIKIFENRKAEIRFTLRDKNPGLMEKFLTKGSKSIPVVLVLDDTGEFIMRFGPRPAKAQAIFEAHREEIAKGKIEKKEVTRKIRTFYAKDCGQSISEEFTTSLNHKLSVYSNRKEEILQNNQQF